MNYACPNLECSQGRIYDRNGINGSLSCPICAGRGFIAQSLPVPTELKLVASDLGLTRNASWRPMQATGSLHGLPISGKAVATDGCLVVLELATGQQFIGHLDNFVKDKREKQEGKAREPKPDVNEGLL